MTGLAISDVLIVEAMYEYLRRQAKEKANIKPIDYSTFFEGKTAYEVLQIVVSGYMQMNHQENMMNFYKLLHFASQDMSAVSFAMTIHGRMDYELDKSNGGCRDESEENLLVEYLKWFCEENAV